jgi:FixJ family two-component response regulator
MATDSEEPSRFAIVDDDPYMAQLVRDMLLSGGVKSQIYGLGLDLLKCADLPKFKSIVLDLSLPDIGGFDIMDNLAADAIGSSVLVMSGHDPATVRAANIYGKGIGLKMLGALVKPFSRSDLFDALGLPL